MIRFLFKRVMVLAVIIAVTVFLFNGCNLKTPVGILIGAVLSLYKIRLTGIFTNILVRSGKRIVISSVLINIFSQVFIFLILTVAVLADVSLFFGIAAGFILLPVFICVNGTTEKIGISHNEWM